MTTSSEHASRSPRSEPGLGGLLGGDVPRTGPPIHREHVTPARPRRGRIPGETGVWVFLLGDMTAFALMFVVLVNARMDEPEVFETSRQSLHLTFGALNTILLLLGSLLVVRGIRALRTGSPNAPKLFLATIATGVWFVVNKFVEYGLLIDEGHSVNENLFYGYYFMLTGAHLLHLLLALVCMTIVWRMSRRAPLTTKDTQTVEAIGAYWHLVDLLWVVLFPLIYLMRV